MPVPACRRVALLMAAAFLLCQCATPRQISQLPAMHASLTHWTARDGKELPCQHWPGEPKHPSGIVICIHGLSGAASDSVSLISVLQFGQVIVGSIIF